MTTSNPQNPAKLSPNKLERYDHACRVAMQGDDLALIAYAYLSLSPHLSRNAQAEGLKLLRAQARKKQQFTVTGVNLDDTKTASDNTASKSYGTIIKKPQASNWAHASSVQAEFPRELSQGWNYRLVNFSIYARADSRKWRGNLMVVYERHSNQFFHHFITVTNNFGLSVEQVVYMLARIDQQMKVHPLAAIHAGHPRSLWLPDIQTTAATAATAAATAATATATATAAAAAAAVHVAPTAKVYKNVLAYFNNMKNRQWTFEIKWKAAKDPLQMIVKNWHVQSSFQVVTPFIHMAATQDVTAKKKPQHSPKFPTALEFSNALLKISADQQNWYSLTPSR